MARTQFAERSQFTGSRWDMHPALPAVVGSLLDVGCGQGQGFAHLRSSGTRVVGLDHDEATITAARPVLDAVYQLDLARDPWPDELLESFDVVALCDVLEHLYDPWDVLARVRALLRLGGRVIISVPNVRQVRHLIKVGVLGRWDYRQDGGVLFESHIRFFTRRSLYRALLDSGYREPRFYYPRRTFHLFRPERILNLATFGVLADLLYNSLTVSAVAAEPSAARSPALA